MARIDFKDQNMGKVLTNHIWAKSWQIKIWAKSLQIKIWAKSWRIRRVWLRRVRYRLCWVPGREGAVLFSWEWWWSAECVRTAGDFAPRNPRKWYCISYVASLWCCPHSSQSAWQTSNPTPSRTSGVCTLRSWNWGSHPSCRRASFAGRRTWWRKSCHTWVWIPPPSGGRSPWTESTPCSGCRIHCGRRCKVCRSSFLARNWRGRGTQQHNWSGRGAQQVNSKIWGTMLKKISLIKITN